MLAILTVRMRMRTRRAVDEPLNDEEPARVCTMLPFGQLPFGQQIAAAAAQAADRDHPKAQAYSTGAGIFDADIRDCASCMRS